MKSFSQYLTESQVNEVFTSDMIRDIVWPVVRGYGNWKKYYKWDSIADEDLQKFDSVADALTSARKRTEVNVIFWFTTDNDSKRLTGITNGTTVLIARLQNNQLNKADLKATTPKIAAISTEAYQLVDAKKFSTADLRNDRIAMREAAMAIKNAITTCTENMTRYKADRAKTGVPTLKQDVVGWFDNAMENYNTCISIIQKQIEDIINDPTLIEGWQIIKRKVQKLEGIVAGIMAKIEGYDTTPQNAKEWHDDIVRISKQIQSELEDFSVVD